MQICLVGYLDNTVENKLMLDTYELRNDFWAENFKFRRKDLKPITDEELEWVSAWIDREIIKKHRTNWLSDKNPAYIDSGTPGGRATPGVLQETAGGFALQRVEAHDDGYTMEGVSASAEECSKTT